jgi:hypothetical protein
VLDNIPDEVNLQDTIQENVAGDAWRMQQLNDQIIQLREMARLSKLLLWVGWGIVALCLLLLLLLRAKPVYAMFGWLGMTLLFLVLEVGLSLLGVWSLPQLSDLSLLLFDTTNAQITEAVLALVTAILETVAARLFWPLLWAMVVLAAAMVISFILRALLHRQLHPK